MQLFTGTAGAPPAMSAVGATDLTENSTLDILLALRARGGRDARAPSEQHAP
jgi:hypothetical protein